MIIIPLTAPRPCHLKMKIIFIWLGPRIVQCNKFVAAHYVAAHYVGHVAVR